MKLFFPSEWTLGEEGPRLQYGSGVSPNRTSADQPLSAPFRDCDSHSTSPVSCKGAREATRKAIIASLDVGRPARHRVEVGPPLATVDAAHASWNIYKTSALAGFNVSNHFHALVPEYSRRLCQRVLTPLFRDIGLTALTSSTTDKRLPGSELCDRSPRALREVTLAIARALICLWQSFSRLFATFPAPERI